MSVCSRARPWLGVWLLLAACQGEPAPREPAPREPAPLLQPSAGTRWQSAEPAHHSAWLEAPARVLCSPNDTALLSVPLSARVLRVRVHAGQKVAAGEPLIDVLMPELIRAAGALRSADLRLASLLERRGMMASLLAQHLARGAELSELDASIAGVRGERESARATLRAAGEPDVRAAALLEGNGAVSLKAPIAGTVVSVSAQLGQSREPAAGPLLELVADDADARVEARFLLPPPASARLEWVEPTRTVPLVLETISPHADERDGSRTGWLHVAEGQAQLVAGSLGRVRVVAEPTWVTVPASALRSRAGDLTVEVKTPQGSAPAPVQLIQQSHSEALVTGIRAGTLIATDVSAVRVP